MKKKYRCGLSLLLLEFALASGCSRTDDPQTLAESGGDHVETPYRGTEASKMSENVLDPLESLIAPIALFPDPLLAEILTAAAYPPEIGRAARHLQTGAAPVVADDLDLDASVRRLESLPPTIIMMYDHSRWTAALGEAFLTDPKGLLDAVQILRVQAKRIGALKDTKVQRVVERGATFIFPSEAGKINMPLYDAEKVFAASLAAVPEKYRGPDSSQMAASDVDHGEISASFYPVYNPAAEEAGDSGAGTLGFGSDTSVPDLMTWGEINWSGEAGFYIGHAYGGVTACAASEDCWLRSSDDGYHYTDELHTIAASAAVSGAAGALSGMIPVSTKPWRFDARHRRGFPFVDTTAEQNGYLGAPPLAGQLFSAHATTWRERGYIMPPAPQPADDLEESPKGKNIANAGEVLSLFSAFTAFEANGVKEKLSSESRNQTNQELPQPNSTSAPTVERAVEKPTAKQAEPLPDMIPKKQPRDRAFSSIFSGVDENARLTLLFAKRGGGVDFIAAQRLPHKSAGSRSARQ